jgi:hypothetical protein
MGGDVLAGTTATVYANRLRSLLTVLLSPGQAEWSADALSSRRFHLTGGHMTEASTHSLLCAVVGVGPGNGAAFVRRFVKEGYRVAMIARSGKVMDALATELPQARAYRCDVGDPAQIEATFAGIAADLGPVDALIYNAGKGVGARWRR